MSQISLEVLTAKRPDLADVWYFLTSWLASHPKLRSVSIDRLAKADRNIAAGKLAEALDYLRTEGLVREVYRVKDLDGTFLGDEYESPRQVPERVPDRFHEAYVETAERDVVPWINFDSGSANESE